jgi:hypothetical protein
MVYVVSAFLFCVALVAVVLFAIDRVLKKDGTSSSDDRSLT